MSRIVEEIKTQCLKLSREDERLLIAKYKATGDKSAREKLLRSKYGLALNIANKMQTLSYKFDDCLADAMQGLILAIDRHQPERGSLSTAAVIYIRMSIYKGMKEYNNDYGQQSASNNMLVLLQACEEYEAGVSLDVLRRKYRKKKDTIRGFYQAQNAIDGLVEPDWIPDETGRYDDMTEYNDMAEKIRKALSVFPNLERKILEMEYGIDTEKRTRREIAGMYGISHQRVSQICKKAGRQFAARWPWMREFLYK